MNVHPYRGEGPATSRLSLLLAAFALLAGLVPLAALAIAGVAFGAGALHPAGAVLVGTVGKVIDGDTLVLQGRGEALRIRLAEIDAPELSQPHGREAKAALERLVGGKPVSVTVVDTDRYGRVVGLVRLGREDVNGWLVRQGHAWAYTRYSPSLAILDSEQAARRAGLGLWRLPPAEREAPWQWRSQRRHAAPPSPAAGRAAPQGALDCAAPRSCGQLASCAEARAWLEQCKLQSLDGDGDGTPCERLCGRR